MKKKRQYILKRSKKIERNKRKRKDRPKTIINMLDLKFSNLYRDPIDAPNDFRLIANTEDCLSFFRKIRHRSSHGSNKGIKIVKINLEHIEKIDFASINILKAISEDLRSKNTNMQGDLPKNPVCKKFIIESGFLNHMFDEENRRFKFSEKADEIIFEKGMGKLTESQSKRLSMLIPKMMEHLTGNSKHFPPLRTVLLEICGNSIEHAYKSKGKWSIDLKYENNKVLINVTDLGCGIIETLHRKHGQKFFESLQFTKSHDILHNAFLKKYGSSTLETNRNKGLPAIKKAFDDGIINSLKVITNDVILHFDNGSLSKTISDSKNKLRGTLYQWELNGNSLN